jgi:hypothetical protein
MFIVKFYNLTENTVSSFEYEHLFEALAVAKNTDISDSRINVPAMSNDKFDSELFTLLTSGFIYCGDRTPEHPDGEYMVGLVKRDFENGDERVVYSALPMPQFAINGEGEVKATAPLPRRPVQHNA